MVGKQTFEPVHPLTIVGMVGNVRARGLQTTPFPEVYISSRQFSWPNIYVVVRSAIPQAQLVKMVKAAIQSSNSNQAVFGVMTMDELIADSVTEPRFHAFLIGAFALLAVAMAAAGIYSVISLFRSAPARSPSASRWAPAAATSSKQCWGPRAFGSRQDWQPVSAWDWPRAGPYDRLQTRKPPDRR